MPILPSCRPARPFGPKALPECLTCGRPRYRVSGPPLDVIDAQAKTPENARNAAITVIR
jgi:hypothetical protein